LILVSDGVHDNFDPVMLGMEPSEFGLTSLDEYGQNVSLQDLHKAQIMERTLKDVMEGSPQDIADALIEHCRKTTNNSREYMLAHPMSKEPHDYKLFPGKMDHTTCLVYQVGKHFSHDSDSHSTNTSPVSTSVSYSPTSMSLNLNTTQINNSSSSPSDPPGVRISPPSSPSSDRDDSNPNIIPTTTTSTDQQTSPRVESRPIRSASETANILRPNQTESTSTSPTNINMTPHTPPPRPQRPHRGITLKYPNDPNYKPYVDSSSLKVSPLKSPNPLKISSDSIPSKNAEQNNVNEHNDVDPLCSLTNNLTISHPTQLLPSPGHSIAKTFQAKQNAVGNHTHQERSHASSDNLNPTGFESYSSRINYLKTISQVKDREKEMLNMLIMKKQEITDLQTKIQQIENILTMNNNHAPPSET
jgi:hypothetical protein